MDIRITVSLVCTLLWAGCTIQLNPEPETEGVAIGFQAQSLLLEDITTKGTTERFNSNEDSFSIFGERVTATDEHNMVFNGAEVKHNYVSGVQDVWFYDPARYWLWTSQSDRYDFVAVSPANVGTTNENAVGNLSVSTHYNYYVEGYPERGDQYDLLAATYRRYGNNWERRYETVNLSFSHMGSAVGVKVTNNSASASLTLTSIQYKNLVVSADAKATLDSYGRTVLRWANPTPSAAAVRQISFAPSTTVTPGNTYPDNANVDYQIMIPQNLSMFGAKLILNYKVGDDDYSSEIALSDIKRSDDTAITSWEIGYKYIYTIYVRMDGGLQVTVTTTPWDEPVAAETPGILI